MTCLAFAIASADTAPQSMKRGLAAYDKGALAEAAQHWQQAADLYHTEKNPKGQVEALVNLGSAYQALGQNRLATETLKQAVAIAEPTQDRATILLAKSALAGAGTCGQDLESAERNLRECLAMAEADTNQNAAAILYNNLGNLLAAQGKTAAALDAYQQATDRTTNELLAAKAAVNAAACNPELNGIALLSLDGLPVTHEKAFLLIRAGQTDAKNQQPARALDSYRQAQQIAEQLGDRRALSYALGYRAQLQNSIELTRQAAFIAQEIQAPEALYRWEWQLGRLHKAQGDRQAALAAYRRAVQTLQSIHYDLAMSQTPFRESVGPVYFELADLLLQESQLTEARDTIEQVKSVEIDDYFRDECMALLRSKAARIENVDPRTAVIYVIPLADRTELLVGCSDGLKRFTAAVTAAQLTAEVRTFRQNLEKRGTNQYLTQARQLYQWLIVPIRETLAKQRVETLVFVPDGALRNIPLGALQDGERFLIEQFAVAVSPGLTLLAPQPMPRKNLQVLAVGLSEGVQDFPALPSVKSELASLQTLFGASTLLDGQFLLPELKEDFAKNQFQVVHFATHGQFNKNAGESFILTHDGKLTFDQLEEMLRPSRARGKPVELLTLSACQTAAGDDRAALGLAGVAIKAGARSSLATLWFVQDESTAIAVTEFYGLLKRDAGISKAKALQLAQLKLLRDPRFEHPGFWAPYLMIGNWL
jgi:CHAT domain-containing protein